LNWTPCYGALEVGVLLLKHLINASTFASRDNDARAPSLPWPR